MTPFSILTADEPLWPEDFLSDKPGTLLQPRHCEDVLRGSYDVPFDPATPPVILDIGANVGAFTRWAVRRWPGATVHAYEPAPENFARLERTVAALPGGPTMGRVFVSQLAVFDQEGQANLAPKGYNCGEYGLSEPANGSVVVSVMHARDLPRADILKIDTEGAEGQIIDALYEAGRLHEFSAIMMEYHADYQAEQLIACLTDNGFDLYEQNSHGQHRGEIKFLRKTNGF